MLLQIQKKLLSSLDLDRNSKRNIYKGIMKSILTYGSRAWALSKADEELLKIFERKILRKILGSIRQGNGWRSRMNDERERLRKGVQMLFVSSRHVIRMSNDRRVKKKTVEWKPERKRRRWLPRKRWEGGKGRLKNNGHTKLSEACSG